MTEQKLPLSDETLRIVGLALQEEASIVKLDSDNPEERIKGLESLIALEGRIGRYAFGRAYPEKLADVARLGFKQRTADAGRELDSALKDIAQKLPFLQESLSEIASAVHSLKKGTCPKELTNLVVRSVEDRADGFADCVYEVLHAFDNAAYYLIREKGGTEAADLPDLSPEDVPCLRIEIAKNMNRIDGLLMPRHFEEFAGACVVLSRICGEFLTAGTCMGTGDIILQAQKLAFRMKEDAAGLSADEQRIIQKAEQVRLMADKLFPETAPASREAAHDADRFLDAVHELLKELLRLK